MSNLIFNPAVRMARTRDGFQTYDQRTIDSTGAFLIGELERLDQTLHEPLVSITWTRDIDLREDVTIADETSSFTNSSFAAAGGVALPNSGNGGGKAWVGKDASAIASMQLDIAKTAQPLTLWAMETSWTIPELESAQKLGRPVDQQKFRGMKLKHQMDVDEMVYVGDAQLGFKGMVNNANVSASNVPNGSWTVTTAAANMLADVNSVLNAAYAATGYAFAPSHLLLPPTQFSVLATTLISSAGTLSVLEYIKINSVSNAVNGRPLIISPVKWLTGAGASSTNRMVAYTKEEQYVRFPMVPLQRTPLEYRSLFQLTTYFGRLGVVECVYPETLAYGDGI
jgi:hypothetical protein